MNLLGVSFITSFFSLTNLDEITWLILDVYRYYMKNDYETENYNNISILNIFKQSKVGKNRKDTEHTLLFD